jgi:hypothetical protein
MARARTEGEQGVMKEKAVAPVNKGDKSTKGQKPMQVAKVDTRQLTIRIPNDIHRMLKIRVAAGEAVSMGGIIIDLLRDYLELTIRPGGLGEVVQTSNATLTAQMTTATGQTVPAVFSMDDIERLHQAALTAQAKSKPMTKTPR